MRFKPILVLFLFSFLILFYSCAPTRPKERPQQLPVTKESPQIPQKSSPEYGKAQDEKDSVKKLQKLREMRQKGLITEQEYQDKKKEILDNL